MLTATPLSVKTTRTCEDDYLPDATGGTAERDYMG